MKGHQICAFCKNKIEVGTGFSIFSDNGSNNHYCGTKCFRNKKLGRDGSKTKWVYTYHKKLKSTPSKNITTEENETSTDTKE